MKASHGDSPWKETSKNDRAANDVKADQQLEHDGAKKKHPSDANRKSVPPKRIYCRSQDHT